MKKPRPSLPKPSEAQQWLDNPILQGVLNGFRSQAVILDGEGHLLASSEDALPALGLPCPFPAEAQFPALEALDLAAKGFQASVLPVRLGSTRWEVNLFKDIRGSVRQEELAAACFEELQGTLAALEALVPQAGVIGLQEVSATLGRQLENHRRLLLPQQWGTAKPPALPGWLGGGRPDAEAEPDPEPRDDRDVILVVDDSVMVLRLLEVLLAKEDFRVITAQNGEQGLNLAYEYLPDLILLDAVMPGLDGFQVCHRLKADVRTREIPVLFVTALRGETDEVFALEAGAIDFIPKPITPAIVVARVRNHLELKHSKDQLRVLSLVDGLTGIANRRHFDQCLEVEWQRASRNGRPLSLVMGDVDFFKRYNDHFGHAQGDQCLRQVAQVFRQALRRPGDLAARFGGEEFMCVLPDTDEAGARLVAEKVQAGLAELGLPHPGSEVVPKVTLSLGVATVRPGLYGCPADLVQEVDRTMYDAKHNGRNGIAP